MIFMPRDIHRAVFPAPNGFLSEISHRYTVARFFISPFQVIYFTF